MKKEKTTTILLTEDDPFLIDIYSTKIKEAGFEVEIAQNGEECLAKVREKKPDILVLDIVLPQINGWEVLRKIRNDENLKYLKIIILSNLCQKTEIEEGFKLGATKYLIKAHYTPSEVVNEIKKLLE